MKNSAQRKTERLEARIAEAQKALLQRAAELQGRSLTDFVVSVAMDEARRIVSEADVLELTRRDQLALADALMNPPPAGERLKRGAREYMEQID